MPQTKKLCGGCGQLKRLVCYLTVNNTLYNFCKASCYTTASCCCTQDELDEAFRCVGIGPDGIQCSSKISVCDNSPINMRNMCCPHLIAAINGQTDTICIHFDDEGQRCNSIATERSSLCRKHHVAKKKGITVEAAMEERNKNDRELRQLGRQESNRQYEEMMQEVKTQTLVGGLDGYLACVSNLVDGEIDFNKIKGKPFACPYGEYWVNDDNGFPSQMAYKFLPSGTKDALGHSQYYSKTKRGEPEDVYAHANPVSATHWYCKHWKDELRRYLNADSSRYQEVNGVIGVFVIVKGDVKERHHLLAKCADPTTPSAVTSHFFPLNRGEFHPDKFLWWKRDESQDMLIYTDANPGNLLNLRFDDSSLTFDSSGIKSVHYDKLKLAKTPTFNKYKKKMVRKPATLTSAPDLNDHDADEVQFIGTRIDYSNTTGFAVAPDINLVPRITKKLPEKQGTLKKWVASYETPKTTVVDHLTVVGHIDSPPAIKKAKTVSKPSNCPGCGLVFDIESEYKAHHCKLA
eukprot:scaffold98554_cov59-Cyclotella_meneghiniana.AAC.1